MIKSMSPNWLLVSGYWSLVPGSGSLVAGVWFLVADCWHLVAGRRYGILTDTDACLNIGLGRTHILGPVPLPRIAIIGP